MIKKKDRRQRHTKKTKMIKKTEDKDKGKDEDR